MNKPQTVEEILREEVKNFSSPLTPEGLQLLVHNVAIEHTKQWIEYDRIQSKIEFSKDWIRESGTETIYPNSLVDKITPKIINSIKLNEIK
jgi:hypothetical protein